MIEYILYFVGGYLVGSIPTAFIVGKLISGIDIRSVGSGNVGAYNTFEFSKSKTLGFIVGVIDALKGFVVTYITWQYFTPDVWLQIIAFFGVIIGHNYPVWLRFKGGRGLASALGGYLAIGVTHIVIWCLLWVIAYRFSKKILRANLYAILLSPILVLLLPASVIELGFIRDINVMDFRLLVYIVSSLHLLSHIDELKKNLIPQKTL